jgi:uncharacterized protein
MSLAVITSGILPDSSQVVEKVYRRHMPQRNFLLREQLHKLYIDYNEKLPAHGWPHVAFVVSKSLVFADELAVDKEIVEAAAFVHDLNYIADPKSHVEAGADLRHKYLDACGFSVVETTTIEDIVCQASTKNRHADIRDEAKALADADSLYKVLPISLIVFAGRFIAETGVTIEQWANTIMRQQQPLLDDGLYFYTKEARDRYLPWAELNLKVVETIQSSLNDSDVKELLESLVVAGILDAPRVN